MISQSLLIVGAMTYVLAWFLPTIEHRDDVLGVKKVTVYYGWFAFGFALRSEGFSFARLLSTGSALTNFILVAGLAIVPNTLGVPHLLRTTLVVCAVLNTHWLRMDNLRIGYYWWAGSFFLISAGLVPGRGFAAAWNSSDGIAQAALLVISATAILAGIYVELRRTSVDAKASEETPPGRGTSNSDDSRAPRDDHDKPAGETPARRGSNWFLAGGIVAALVTWFLLSQTPRNPSVKRPRAGSPKVSTPRLHSSPADGHAKSAADSEIGRDDPRISPAVVAPPIVSASDEAPAVVAALRRQARDLRRNIEPFLYDPSLRDAASEAERILAQGEDLLRRDDRTSAATRFRDASAKLEIVRASAQRNLAEKRLAEQSAQNAGAARQRFTPDQAIQYAQLTYSRGQQFEGRADAAYRSRDYRSASQLYASANREYDTVLETIAQSRRAEEQLQATSAQEARDAARRLQEEQARELTKRQSEERAQKLREQDALRAKAKGKIRKIRLNFVTYGGGQNPELEILVDFDVEGMKGVDGEVVVFLFSQQVGGFFDRAKGPFEALKGSGSDRNGVYAHAKYTPGYDTAQYSKFRLAISTSRFNLPKGSNRVLAAVYVRTGGSGALERDLDGMSEDILLDQP